MERVGKIIWCLLEAIAKANKGIAFSKALNILIKMVPTRKKSFWLLLY